MCACQAVGSIGLAVIGVASRLSGRAPAKLVGVGSSVAESASDRTTARALEVE